MRKVILFCFFVTYLAIPIFSQQNEIIYASEIDGFVTISNETIDLNILDYQNNGKHKYRIETRNNIRFISYAGTTNIICSSRQLLYLVDSRRCFYYGVGYTGNGRSGRHSNFIGPANRYKTSSFLIEGNIKYGAENLSFIRPNRPWVEGVSGDGIGEYIELECDYEMSGLIIVNGFISLDKPELFLFNNRVKSIRVSIDGNSEKVNYELEDTSNPQIIRLPTPGKRVKVEVAGVYKGSKWDDTCISMIQVISIGAYDVFFDP